MVGNIRLLASHLSHLTIFKGPKRHFADPCSRSSSWTPAVHPSLHRGNNQQCVRPWSLIWPYVRSIIWPLHYGVCKAPLVKIISPPPFLRSHKASSKLKIYNRNTFHIRQTINGLLFLVDEITQIVLVFSMDSSEQVYEWRVDVVNTYREHSCLVFCTSEIDQDQVQRSKNRPRNRQKYVQRGLKQTVK